MRLLFIILVTYLFEMSSVFCQNKTFQVPFICFSKSEYVVNNEACQISVSVKHNIPYFIEIEPSYAAKWIKWRLSNDSLIIDVAKRNLGSVRECNLIAYSEDRKYRDTFIIKEDKSRRLAGKYNNPIYFVHDGLFVDTDSITRTILIRHTIPYTLNIEPTTAKKWINYTQNDSVIYIHIQKNSKDNNRECFIIASSSDRKYKAQCHILQYGKAHNKMGSDNQFQKLGSNVVTNNQTIKSYPKKDNSRKTKVAEHNGTYSGRCQAITKAGYRCSRTATRGFVYCWQHNM